MKYIVDEVDVVVIGGGHAGCESALATARLGLKTVLFAVNLDSIAMMPCNPSIGGTSKGHLVREVDALGGAMGQVIDETYLQSRMLNTGKGPAVHSLRAQADKHAYSRKMKYILETTPNLLIRQSEIVRILVENRKVTGVEMVSGGQYLAKAVIIATGTYLRARCIYGEVSVNSGPNGLQAANYLSDSLLDLGIEMQRFKTGTPARIDRKSIDFSKISEQKGDTQVVPFSFTNQGADIERPQVSCWLTYTNEETHQIIRDNLYRSPLYGGDIEGTGPRYCPSIEDKVVRFADKDRHQLFLEPEAEFTNEMYVQGMSSSLPEDVQQSMLRTVPGLEKCDIMRTGYAIEYDCINPLQLKASLEFKTIDSLFSAGQINGSSGYEEAAGQGIIAGINAAMKLLGKQPLVLDRSEGYIGVLIDDLVTKGAREPYRMMTSRSEYRLLLRQDNADLRLTDYGYQIGLIDEQRYHEFLLKKEAINDELKRLQATILGVNHPIQAFLIEKGSANLKSGISLYDLLKRPELTYQDLAEFDDQRPDLSAEIIEQVNIQIKYEGYIIKQKAQVEQFKKMEKKKIPIELDYNEIINLRIEARQKLQKIKPDNIGQASRISGVSPADISVLVVYLDYLKRRQTESKEKDNS